MKYDLLYIQLRNGFWYVWSGISGQADTPKPNKRDKRFSNSQKATSFAEWWSRHDHRITDVVMLRPL